MNSLQIELPRTGLNDRSFRRAAATHFPPFFYSLLATRYSLHFSPMSEPKLTPMMQQYFEVKRVIKIWIFRCVS